ncbi:MAG: hypothetical protein ACKV2U_07555 [Bryobacteraceae bacterium]
MRLDELKALWASAENGLSADGAQSFAAAAVAQVNRERRRRRGTLAYVFVMVPLVTIAAGWQLVGHGTGWEEAWPALLILGAQWIAALYLLRIFRQGQGAAAERPIRVTLETLLRQVEARCRELQTLLGLFLVVVPLTAIAIVQLQANGKMRPNEAASAAVVAAVILLGMGGWFVFDLLARKLPEKRQLETLLREYRA